MLGGGRAYERMRQVKLGLASMHSPNTQCCTKVVSADSAPPRPPAGPSPAAPLFHPPPPFTVARIGLGTQIVLAVNDGN